MEGCSIHKKGALYFEKKTLYLRHAYGMHFLWSTILEGPVPVSSGVCSEGKLKLIFYSNHKVHSCTVLSSKLNSILIKSRSRLLLHYFTCTFMKLWMYLYIYQHSGVNKRIETIRISFNNSQILQHHTQIHSLQCHHNGQSPHDGLLSPHSLGC